MEDTMKQTGAPMAMSLLEHKTSSTYDNTTHSSGISCALGLLR